MSAPSFSFASAQPRIAEFLGRILPKTGLDLTFKVEPASNPLPDFENPEVMVRFEGGDIDELLANRAELLLALEHLTMEMLQLTQEQHTLLCFDANDWRLMRIQELRMTAQAAAERVKESGQPYTFNPMTSRERRIIHLALRNETAVRSESLGMGPTRSVVIYPAGMPSLPTPPVPQRPMGGRGGRRR